MTFAYKGLLILFSRLIREFPRTASVLHARGKIWQNFLVQIEIFHDLKGVNKYFMQTYFINVK